MKNSTIRYVFLLFAMVSLYLTSCKKDEELKLDFDITVPDSWNYTLYDNEGLIYGAARRPVSIQDSIMEALYIWKEPLKGYDLEAYYASKKTKITDSKYYDSLLYESDTVINTTSFKKMLSLEKQMAINGYRDTFYLDVVTSRYFFFEKNNGYNMYFISLDTLFYKNRPVFDNIMSTFKYHY